MEKSERSGATWALVVVALPLLYVLSTGPIVLYFEKSQQPPPPWMVSFYTPIDWAWKNSTLRKPLETYLEFWRKLGH